MPILLIKWFKIEFKRIQSVFCLIALKLSSQTFNLTYKLLMIAYNSDLETCFTPSISKFIQNRPRDVVI